MASTCLLQIDLCLVLAIGSNKLEMSKLFAFSCSVVVGAATGAAAAAISCE